MPTLIVERGPRAGAELAFDKSVVIGRNRNPATQLWLDHASVSRRHAMILRVEDGHVVVDLGSANGTFVDGRRIARPTPLCHGQTIEIGAVAVRFSDPARAASAPTTTVLRVRDEDRTEHQRHVLLRLPASEDQFAPGEAADAGMAASMARRLEFLNRLGAILSEGFDRAALLSFVLEALLDILPQADRAFIMLDDPAAGGFVPHAARTRAGEVTDVGVSRTLVNEAVRRREALVVLDTQTDAAYAESESIRLLGLRSVMCAPLVYNGEVTGVLQVDSSRPGSPFGRPDAALLVGIACQVALVLALARLHERALERELLDHDLSLARRIQRQFFPDSLPRVPGYSLAAEYAPALAVGGDFYDVFPLGDGRIAVLAGDVAGKGVSAALLVARLTSDIRYHAAGCTEPRDILRRVNASLEPSASEGMFATVCLLVLETATGRLSLANAGHPGPLLRDPDGAVTVLAAPTCAPLGLAESAAINHRQHQLPRGAALVLFTDGITEALSPTHELFGLDRLREEIARGTGGAPALQAAIVSAVTRFRAGTPQSDDLTLVVVARDR